MQVNGTTQVHGPQSIRSPHKGAAPEPVAPSRKNHEVDQVEISQQAQFVSQAKELPEIRSDLVNRIKSEIESGQYETDEKLDIALDRFP